ncbi:hypothetical protein LNV23_20140 [Paucibacter sp. DJ1R-11]|uniref:hypothetical protein n=1 Tax=Paucibacter sp. DJ1R-11 TaxID=2893556 RepID=UPI0021E3BD3C|nr:hypothetical protein [Paucibacter sp. DJ1R-11]MCV2365765.1 hypothetical protein [Paucibacter sp. DJ1R-11]
MFAYRVLSLQMLAALLVGWLLAQALHQPFVPVLALVLGGTLAGAFGRSFERWWSTAQRSRVAGRYVAGGLRLLIGCAVIVLLVLILRAALLNLH